MELGSDPSSSVDMGDQLIMGACSDAWTNVQHFIPNSEVLSNPNPQ